MISDKKPSFLMDFMDERGISPGAGGHSTASAAFGVVSSSKLLQTSAQSSVRVSWRNALSRSWGYLVVNRCEQRFTCWCLGNRWEWGLLGIIITYYGSFPHSLLSTSKQMLIVIYGDLKKWQWLIMSHSLDAAPACLFRVSVRFSEPFLKLS